MIDPEYYNKIFDYIDSKIGNTKISAALVLGSGLGDFDQQFNNLITLFTKDIPGYPVSTVQGHSGKISLCEFLEKKYLVFSGRVHPYEGYPIDRLVLNVAISNHLNIKSIILTNAAGGINPDFVPGDLMLIDDIHLLHFTNRFKLLADIDIIGPALDETLNDKLFTIASQKNIQLIRGTYAYMLGPSYETPAEIRALWNQGCDAVGMSTIPEILLAKKFKMNIIAISAITNFAAGLKNEKITHEHVQKIAQLIKIKFSDLLKLILSQLD